MEYLHRHIHDNMLKQLGKGKAILLLGARQTGKTTLIRNLIKEENLDVVYLTGDDDFDVELFATPRRDMWNQILGSKKAVFIDEAQRITHIGRSIKLLLDQRTDVQVFLSGSSSFQLANLLEEPLTGRKYEYSLYPLSFSELSAHHGVLEERKLLESRLLYGSYPQIITDLSHAQENLEQLSDSYLYRDLLSYKGIRKPKLLEDLLKALAYQVGNEVTPSELASLLGVSRGTVESYLSLLEQAQIVFCLQAFSTNQRNEIKKGRKYYFWDTGIRNAVIRGFDPIASRTDVGALWENYLIAERRKLLMYRGSGEQFFWRTTDQMVVDYIERTFSKLSAYECKWNDKKQSRVTKAFSNRYPEASLATITPATYAQFLGEEESDSGR